MTLALTLAVQLASCSGASGPATGGAEGRGNSGGPASSGGSGVPSSGGNSGGVPSSGGSGGAANAEVWAVDNTASIAGLTPVLIGAPTVTPGTQGQAVCFDGDDGLLLDRNPIESLSAFTLQVLFQPLAVTTAEASLNQPRFLHIEDAAGARATLEARVNETQFYLDTFLQSAGASSTLIDDSKVHPVGQWYWAALSYSDGQMRHYLNAVEEAAAAVSIAPLGPGKMSLGVRQNLVHWFKGCIRELRISATALPAGALQSTSPPG
jgi:hypothetical protein